MSPEGNQAFPEASTDASLANNGGQAALFTDAAPRKIIKRFASGDADKAWRAWIKHLGRRRAPKLRRLFGGRGLRALSWGLHKTSEESRLFSRQGVNDNGNRLSLDAHLRTLIEMPRSGDDLDQAAALELLACAYQLPALAAEVSRPAWWALVEHLRQNALDAAVIPPGAAPLVHQWLAGEMPLALATLLPEVARCAELLSGAQRALATGMEELLDGEGLPHWRHLPHQQALVACWARARTLGKLAGSDWHEDAESQFPLAVREMLRLARRDGRSIVCPTPIRSHPSAATRQFFLFAVAASGDRDNARALRRLGFEGSASAQGEPSSHLPPAANHSEWAQVAIMRPRWMRSSPHLAITYGNRTTRGELVSGRNRLLTGDWSWTCLADQQPLEITGEWEEICWVSDNDVDYLELEVSLADGFKVQRQICLARQDDFLFIADAVFGVEPRTLEHRITLPLAAGVTCHQPPDSREIALHATKSRAIALPLTLPEWQSDRRAGELTAAEGRLQLSQVARGSSLYAALWFDLKPARHERAFTWRHLAVAEERKNVSREVAGGYRVQFGKRQWLIYRSLTRARNRTVLGHNLASEFLIARFGRDGAVKPLIEVE
jgi:hypothetical protein